MFLRYSLPIEIDSVFDITSQSRGIPWMILCAIGAMSLAADAVLSLTVLHTLMRQVSTMSLWVLLLDL